MQDHETAGGVDTELMAMLRRHEGEVRGESGQHVVYDDGSGLPIRPGTHVSGNPTIGYGILLSGAGGLSEFEAEWLTNRRLTEFREVLDREIPWWRNLPRKPWLALQDMAYNLGPDGLLSFENMLGALQSGAYNIAADEALNSLWAQQVGQRAQTVAQMFRAGDA